VTIRLKIMALALGLVLLLGFGAIAQVRWATRVALGWELDERAVSIARQVAAQAADMLLVEDFVSMRDLAADTQATHEDVRYILVLDSEGHALAHTFPGQVPADLLAVPIPPIATKGFAVQALESEEGALRDVAVDIFDGRAGRVRVGVSEARLEATVAGLTETLALLVSGASLLAIVGAFVWTVFLTRPLAELRLLANKIASADYSARAPVRQADDVGELARAFNAMAEGLQRAEKAHNLLIERIITVQEDERKRVARELHDNTSQALASLMMSLKLLESARSPDEARRLTADLRAAVDDVIGRVHDLAWELRPSLLDSLGLVPAVQSLVKESARRLGLLVDCEVAGLDDARFPPDVELAVFRIVQESLANVAKHSGAGRASVVLQRRDKLLVVVVEDEGAGFDTERVSQSAAGERHLGLFGMKERAMLVGGRLSVDSAPGRGTTIIAEIPLETA